MSELRKETLEKLINAFRAYYNINLYGEEERPLVARCDYFEHSQKYVLSRKAELWSADSEEFLYLLDVPHLTLELFCQWRDFVHADGMERIHVGPGHMYSFITPVFVCEKCDADALKALRKCRIYKSFHFSLHGWMDYHAALVDLSKNRVYSNRSGHTTAKILKKVLYSKNPKKL